jgi:hypothetical protein
MTRKRVLHREMELDPAKAPGENRQISGSPPGEPLPTIHSLQDKQVQERCGRNPADKDTLHGK